MAEENLKDFLKDFLSDKDKKEKLIQSIIEDGGEGLGGSAVFVDKRTGKKIELKEIIEREGAEAAKETVEDMLQSILKGADRAEVYTVKEINEIVHKVKNGTASENEERIADLFLSGENASKIVEANSAEITKNIISYLIDVTVFFDKKAHYNATFEDYTTAIDMFVLASLMNTKGTVLEKYRNSGASAVVNVQGRIFSAMLDACEKEMQISKMNPELVLIGLLAWINALCMENKFHVGNPQEIAKMYDMDIIDTDEYKDVENNSSESKSDNDMKNLLKED